MCPSKFLLNSGRFGAVASSLMDDSGSSYTVKSVYICTFINWTTMETVTQQTLSNCSAEQLQMSSRQMTYVWKQADQKSTAGEDVEELSKFIPPKAEGTAMAVFPVILAGRVLHQYHVFGAAPGVTGTLLTSLTDFYL